MAEIRFVAEPDDAIYDIQNEIFEDYAQKHGITVGYEPFGFYACENGRIIGAITGNSYYREVHISELAVDKDFRGQDIGTELINAVEDHFKGKGIENINLSTYAFQAPEFYKKCGYEIEFIRKNAAEPKLDKYYMVKHI